MLDVRTIEIARKSDSILFDKNWSALRAGQIVVEFDTPFKNGKIEKKWLINWVLKTLHPTRQEVREAFVLYNRDIQNPEVQSKIENTIRFYDFVKDER